MSLSPLSYDEDKATAWINISDHDISVYRIIADQ